MTATAVWAATSEAHASLIAFALAASFTYTVRCVATASSTVPNELAATEVSVQPDRSAATRLAAPVNALSATVARALPPLTVLRFSSPSAYDPMLVTPSAIVTYSMLAPKSANHGASAAEAKSFMAPVPAIASVAVSAS